jgi:SAM-dependent methyltransferase
MKMEHTEKMRHFYTDEVNKRHGGDYEYSRWHGNTIQESYYQMTKKSILWALRGLEYTSCFELGPGPGTWTRLLWEQEPNVKITLLDISPYMQEQFEREHSGKDFLFQIADFESYAIAKGAYDLIFSIRAIDYIANTRAAVRKLYDGLSHGGTGVIVAKTDHPLKKKLLGQSTEWQHQHILGYQALHDELQQAGCIDISIRPVTVYIPIFGRIHIFNKIIWSIIHTMPMSWWNEWMTESYIARFKKL